MIGIDQKPATFVAASACALYLCFGNSTAARADTPLPVVAPITSAAASTAVPGASSEAAGAALTVALVAGGREATYTTQAKTVGAFLDERAVRVGPADYLSRSLDAPLADGMQIVYRPSVPVVLYVGTQKRVVRTAAETVGDLLHEQNVTPSALDDVVPVQSSRLVPDDVVRVDEVRAWTSKRRARIEPATKARLDIDLAAGDERTLQTGSPGVRETTVHYVRRNDERLQQTVLASRIIRAPRAKIVARGIAAYSSLAHVAALGFVSALHFAGSALHVIATAYTAGCYGCSGITASGVRAGFGVVAVDPRIIPLGTRLFVPGYGRAVAGDTGGAIVGRRVDLGFDTVAQAMRFGRQPMTVYVLK